jgi:hypothetical protein
MLRSPGTPILTVIGEYRVVADETGLPTGTERTAMCAAMETRKAAIEG